MIRLKHKQHGLSLIELMIAVGLSMVLTLGVIQIFVSSKQTSRVQESLARLQENARFALDLLAYDIRMAGQLGCDSGITPVDNSGLPLLRPFGTGIFGYEHAGLPAVLIVGNANNPSAINVVNGTDTIIVMAASPNNIPVSQADTTISPMAGTFDDLQTGEPLLIGDCENADIFIATVAADGTTITTNFNKNYRDFSQLTPLNYSAYYIRENNNQRNLYRSRVNNEAGGSNIDATPLLEGVENMQILYGEDLNGDGSSIRYVAADAVDWNRVRSVRINLLLATLEDGLASEPQGYWFNGNFVAAVDRRLYRSFTTTVQLRNQGI